MERFVEENALFFLLLIGSAAGHFVVLAREPDPHSVTIHVPLQTGQQSVAIMLVAAKKKPEPKIEEIIAEIDDPTATPIPEPKIEVLDEELPVKDTPPEKIVMAETPRTTAPPVPEMAAPKAKEEEEPPPEEEPPRRRKKKETPEPEIEMELVDAAADVTIMTAESTGADVPVSPRTNPHPQYPPSLIGRRIAATVILRVRIGTEGQVIWAIVQQSSGYAEMDNAALTTVRDYWEFNPEIQAGRPVEVERTMPVNFSVRSRRG